MTFLFCSAVAFLILYYVYSELKASNLDVYYDAGGTVIIVYEDKAGDE